MWFIYKHMDLAFLENVYVFSALALLLVLYGSMARPQLPPFIKNLFHHPVFQILIFSLIVYRANHNPTAAIIISVGFLLFMTAVNEYETKEEFEKIEQFRNQ